jgi:hypothetical protein
LIKRFDFSGLQLIFVSPSSIYETLTIAYFGAAGQTEQELADVLVRKFERMFSLGQCQDHLFPVDFGQFSRPNKKCNLVCLLAFLWQVMPSRVQFLTT